MRKGSEPPPRMGWVSFRRAWAGMSREVPPVGRGPDVILLDLGDRLEAGQRKVDALAVGAGPVVDAPEAAAELVLHAGQARARVAGLEMDLVVDAERVEHPAAGAAAEVPHELAVELGRRPVVGRDAVGLLAGEEGQPALPRGHGARFRVSYLVLVQVLVHDLADLVEPVVGRQLGQPLVHELVVLGLEHPGDVIDDARREDAVALVEVPLLRGGPGSIRRSSRAGRAGA